MTIALIVLGLVSGVTAVVGFAAYVIDRSTARQEHKE
jgi:uncharacterized membrane protein YsdA (DUF1294 family)